MPSQYFLPYPLKGFVLPTGPPPMSWHWEEWVRLFILFWSHLMTHDLPLEIPVDIVLPTKWWKPTLYRIHNAITVGDVRVPAQFVSDGASVPRVLWMLFPPIGLYFYAALVHDYLLKTGVSWRVANRHFRRILRTSRVPKWRQYTMIAGVCLWGTLKTNYLAFTNNED